MIRSDATIGGSFPYAPHFTTAPGFRMHYVDEGPREAGVVLCLHGQPTWGYLFRHLIPVLSPTHRVVVPDHIGFENNALITDTWLAAYGSPFASPADCLGAIGWSKGIATGMHKFETPDAAADRAIRGRPALAIWGDADRTLHAEHFLPLFTQLFPAAPVHRLAGVGHYCLEDAPDEIGRLIAEFIRQT